MVSYKFFSSANSMHDDMSNVLFQSLEVQTKFLFFLDLIYCQFINQDNFLQVKC